MGFTKILSLDGGGIRGIMQAVWLGAIEKELNDEFKKSSVDKKELKDTFDLITGVSTGSIIGCAVSAGIDMEKISGFYEDKGANVFPGNVERFWSWAGKIASLGVSQPKYNGEGLEKELKEVFGVLKFGDLKKHTMVVAYDTFDRRSVFFKSWKEEHKDFPVWLVCKASCSAPTYFPGTIVKMNDADIPLIDGGVVGNNPIACAIAEAIRLNKDLNDNSDKMLVLSLGTGSSARRITMDEVKAWGLMEWALPIINVCFEGSNDAMDYIAEKLIGEDQFFRFQVQLDNAFDDMDDASKTNLNALKCIANDYLQGAGRHILRKMVSLFCKLLAKS